MHDEHHPSWIKSTVIDITTMAINWWWSLGFILTCGMSIVNGKNFSGLAPYPKSIHSSFKKNYKWSLIQEAGLALWFFFFTQCHKLSSKTSKLPFLWQVEHTYLRFNSILTAGTKRNLRFKQMYNLFNHWKSSWAIITFSSSSTYSNILSFKISFKSKLLYHHQTQISHWHSDVWDCFCALQIYMKISWCKC